MCCRQQSELFKVGRSKAAELRAGWGHGGSWGLGQACQDPGRQRASEPAALGMVWLLSPRQLGHSGDLEH